MSNAQRIFLSPDQITGDMAHITGQDHLHLARVLRARVGREITVLDGRGNAFRAIIVSIGRSETTARIEEPVPVVPEPLIPLTVAQALGKGDKFEQVIQHGTEIGAGAFIPVQAERCVVELPDAKVAERVMRWQQIARSAAEQSGRAILPYVSDPEPFPALLEYFLYERTVPSTRQILLHPSKDAQSLSQVLFTLDTAHPLFLLIGPEGGWSDAEIAQARAAEVPIVTLGPRVLRTETAALVAISQILYHFEVLK